MRWEALARSGIFPPRKPSSFSYAYDTSGLLLAVTNPDGSVSGNAYTVDAGNYRVLSQATLTQPGGSAVPFMTLNSVDAWNHALKLTAGNGAATTQSFEAATGRLSGLSIVTASSATQTRAYGYDALGLVVSRTATIADTVYPANQTLYEKFTYDGLSRLCTSEFVASAGAAPTATLAGPAQPCPTQGPGFTGTAQTYDAVGDILTKSDVGTYSYAGSTEHGVSAIATGSGLQVNGATNPAFTYDADGNMLSGANRSITWTSFDMPLAISSNAGIDGFVYDDQHRRAKRTVGGSGPVAETIYYFYEGSSPVEKRVTAANAVEWRVHLDFGGRRVGSSISEWTGGTLTSTALNYYGTDGLGSVIQSSSATEIEKYYEDYDAWGRFRNLNGSRDTTGALGNSGTYRRQDRQFTGEEFLQDSSLIHLNGRIYDPQIGRMLSADPVSRPMMPQGMNGYAYVHNGPLNRSDPTGFVDDGGAATNGEITDIIVAAYRPPDVGIPGYYGTLDVYALFDVDFARAYGSATEYCNCIRDLVVPNSTILYGIETAVRGVKGESSALIAPQSVVGPYSYRSGPDLNTLTTVDFDAFDAITVQAQRELSLYSLPPGFVDTDLATAVSIYVEVAGDVALVDSGVGAATLGGRLAIQAITRLATRRAAEEAATIGGRLGSAATRAQNASIAADLESQGNTIIGGGGRLPEEYIPGAGPGTRGSTYVDITAQNNATGAITRVQKIDTLANGSPTARDELLPVSWTPSLGVS